MNTSCRRIAVIALNACVALIYAAPLRGENAPPGGDLTIIGTAVLQDGTPAAGAIVECIGNNVQDPIQCRADAQGHFRLVGHFGYGCPLHARSADELQHATLSIPAAAARTQCAKPIDFKLTRGRNQVVTVTSSDGKPVTGARVAIEGHDYRIHGVTGIKGSVTMSLPLGSEVRAVVAWHPELGAAGKLDYQKGLQDDAFQLVFFPTAPHSIRIVSADGRGVPGVSFGVSASTPGRNWIVADDVEAAQLATDANGEARLSWLPKELEYVNVRIKGHDWKIDEIERNKLAEGLTTVRVRRKLAVSGRLNMPPGTSAEGIVVSGCGFGPTNQGDIPTARAAADGSFTILVVPDHGYGLNITDSQWASNGWSGIILPDEKTEPAQISMDIYRATPVEVRVTRGPEHTPLASAWISLRGEQSFTWRNSQGKRNNATAGIDQWLRTDERGIAHAGVGKGKLTFRISAGTWNEEKTIAIEDEKPVSVEFYRPWSSNRTISGRLTLDGAPFRPSPTAKIEAATDDKPFPWLPLKSQLRADGSFAIEGDADNVTIIVIDRERRMSGFMRVGPDAEAINLDLTVGAAFGGILLDKAGQPLAGKTLRLIVWDTDHPAATDQVADEEGRFNFDLVASNVKLAFQVQDQAEGRPYFHYVDKLLFLPGEERQNARFVADLRTAEERQKSPDAAPPLSEQIAKATRNARLSGMHTLVILRNDPSDLVTRLVENVSHNDDQPDVLYYTLLFVDEKLIKSDAATLQELAWPLPGAGGVVMVALDVEGKQLGSEHLAASDAAAAGKLAAAFLKKHMPAVRDAQARLAAAREEAKRTNKRVWLVEGGPRCGPCFRLSRWMEDQHAILEKDYVILKVMEGLDHHAKEVIDALSRPWGGIPWYAITEPDGKVLVTSDSALGNIGMPSSVEDIRHLREMLTKTAQRITSDDVNVLEKSLEDFK